MTVPTSESYNEADSQILSLEGNFEIFVPVLREENRERSCVPGTGTFRVTFLTA